MGSLSRCGSRRHRSVRMNALVRQRLAIVVSHPIQYYAPLYRRLARRVDVALKVFFTWHAARWPMRDQGFRQPVAWDIPLTEGYEWEEVPNTSSDPGTHRFMGLRNPSLLSRLLAWRPDAVHLTGWAWHSHMLAMRALTARRIPVLFRGDSHLLDERRRGLRWHAKEIVLRCVFRWPSRFLYVGRANREYYEAFGVEPSRLHHCAHSIEVERFAAKAEAYEREAAQWRRELGIPPGQIVVLFAGKFERKKQPVELMRAVAALDDPRIMLIMAGAGELEGEVARIAGANPSRFRVLPFQNQSRMPVVYRLGDLFVLPSAFGETWGLAVNEAMASGRPVIVSDRVGCAADLVDPSVGRVFPARDFEAFVRELQALAYEPARLAEMGKAARARSPSFDIERTEDELMACLIGLNGR